MTQEHTFPPAIPREEFPPPPRTVQDPPTETPLSLEGVIDPEAQRVATVASDEQGRRDADQRHQEELAAVSRQYERKLELFRQGCVDEVLALWALDRLSLSEEQENTAELVRVLKNEKPYLFGKGAPSVGRLGKPFLPTYGLPSLPREAGRIADLAGLDAERRARLAKRLREQLSR